MHLQAGHRQAAPGRRGHRQQPVRRRATMAASRSSASPAPTARPPSPAGRPTCSTFPASMSASPAATASSSTAARSRRPTAPTGTAGQPPAAQPRRRSGGDRERRASHPRRRPALRPLPGRRRHQCSTSTTSRRCAATLKLHEAPVSTCCARRSIVVLPGGDAVLNADDEAGRRMAELCDGEVIFFAADPDLPGHGRTSAPASAGVYRPRRRIMLASGDDEMPSVPPERRPLISGRAKAATIANVLAAVAAGWALGISPGSDRAPASRPSAESLPDTGCSSAPAVATGKQPAAVHPTIETKETVHGSFPHPGPARPQPVEPAYRHPGHRLLRRRPNAPSPTCPVSKTACASAFPKSAT